MTAELNPSAAVAHAAAYTRADAQRWTLAAAEHETERATAYARARFADAKPGAFADVWWRLLLAHRSLAAAMGLDDELHALADASTTLRGAAPPRG